MSRETSFALNSQIKVGYTEKRGNAWWYRESLDTGKFPSHFEGPVPFEACEDLINWDALESPGYFYLPDGQLAAAQNHKFYYRSDNHHVLGVHGNGHMSHPYREWLFDNAAVLLGSELNIGQFGLLRGGAQAFLGIEMADTLTTYAGVDFRPQLLMATSFDGSLASTSKLLSTIVLCDNTLTAGLSERAASYRVKHSSKSVFNSDKARETLGLVEAYGASMQQRIDDLAKAPVSPDRFQKVIEILVPKSSDTKRANTLHANKIDALWTMWKDDKRVAPWRGTEFGVVQLFNTFAHHGARVAGAHRGDRNMERMITNDKAKSFAAVDASSLSALALTR